MQELDPCSQYHFITQVDALYAGRKPNHVPAHLAVLRLALVWFSQESSRAGPSTQVSPSLLLVVYSLVYLVVHSLVYLVVYSLVYLVVHSLV